MTYMEVLNDPAWIKSGEIHQTEICTAHPETR